MATRVNIDISVQSRKRSEEPFRPTDVVVQPFNGVTDVDAYLAFTPTIAELVWDYLVAQRALMWENYLQFEVRLDNVTAPNMGAGAYPLPKGHRSAGLTGSEVVEQETIERALNDIVADLKQKARY